MTWWQMLLGILAVAVVTAGLYVWGLKKAMHQKERLMQMLYQKGSDQVLHYLKKHDTITIKQMEELTRELRAGEFHSKNRAVVTKPAEFARQLADKMLRRGLIEEAEAGKPVYCAAENRRRKKEKSK